MNSVLSPSQWSAWATACWLIALAAFFSVAAEPLEAQINLTPGEQTFLRDHPVIRVHNETNWPPFNFFENEKPRGFSIDYMDLLASMIGVKVEYVTGPTWNEFLGKMKSGELDVMLNIVKTPERQKYLLYTKPYAFNPNSILSLRDTPYNDLKQLFGKTAALPKGFFYEEILTRDFPLIKLHLTKGVAESMKAVLFGPADAALGELAVFNYLMERELMTSLVVSGEVKLGGSNYSELQIAVRRDSPVLASILLKAMDAIDPDEIRTLRQRWINIATTIPQRAKLALTDEEKTWLAAHKHIRLGVNPDYPPFEFVDENGNYAGMASEYVRLVSERLGITMEVVPGLSWNQVIEGVKGGSVDVLPMVTKTPTRDDFMNFSREHLKFPDVIFMPDDHDLVAGLTDMKGRKLALVEGYATTRHILGNYPSVGKLIVKSPLLALKAVAEGEAEATVQNLGVATYLIKKHGLTNLVVAAPADLGMPGLSFGVRKDWPELVPIIDKVLASIKPEEEALIREKWGSTQYQIGINIATVRRVALQAGGVAAVILIMIVFWNRRLGHEIKERKQTEKALEGAYEIIKHQKERMEDELNIGREIQLSMIPLAFPPFPDHHEFSIFALLEPAREVGGDFYDFFFVDDDRLCICIGDVSGKGVPAALFMAMTKTLIKSRAGDDPSPASIITHVNDKLSEGNDKSMFVTVFLGIVNIKTGSLTFTNAGHNPPYLKRANGELQRLGTRHGLVIGAFSGEVYEEGSETMDPGDLLFMYTDGVTEQMDERENLYSEDRLVQILESGDTDSDETVVKRLVSAVERFRGNIEQNDDITILALRYLGVSSKESHGELQLKIQNDLSEIARVQAAFEKFAEKHGLREEMVKRVNLVFEELLGNVISYGFQDDGDHTIDIKVEFNQSRLTSTIKDDGFPFNPINVPAPDTGLPLEQRAEGGLGVHLVRNMVDDIAYQRRIDENVLTFSIQNDRNA